MDRGDKSRGTKKLIERTKLKSFSYTFTEVKFFRIFGARVVYLTNHFTISQPTIDRSIGREASATQLWRLMHKQGSGCGSLLKRHNQALLQEEAQVTYISSYLCKFINYDRLGHQCYVYPQASLYSARIYAEACQSRCAILLIKGRFI